jgi:hypothetical protein
MIRHIVLFSLKNTVTDKELDDLTCDLAGLKDKISGILNFYPGKNSSPEGLGKNYGYGFTMDFQSAEARDKYLPHPDHQLVVKKIMTMLEDGLNSIIAFDYEI